MVLLVFLGLGDSSLFYDNNSYIVFITLKFYIFTFRYLIHLKCVCVCVCVCTVVHMHVRQFGVKEGYIQLTVFSMWWSSCRSIIFWIIHSFFMGIVNLDFKVMKWNNFLMLCYLIFMLSSSLVNKHELFRSGSLFFKCTSLLKDCYTWGGSVG